MLEKTHRLDTSRPFTVAAAVSAGIDPAELRKRSYRRIIAGVYIDADIPNSPAIRSRAALAIHPSGAFASHFSAARLWDLPVPNHRTEDVSVLDPNHRRRRAGIRCHLAPSEAAVRIVEGVPASAPTQVFVELAQYLDLVDLVVVGDALVRRGLASIRELSDAARLDNVRYGSRAREAAQSVRAGVDSPMEARLRMLIVLGGLPEPQVNLKLRNEYGERLAQFDLCHPSVKVIVQYDGRVHIEDAEQHDEDIHRREYLDKHGWRIIVVNSRGIYRHPENTLIRVRNALQDRGFPSLPRRFSEDWRAQFPGWNS